MKGLIKNNFYKIYSNLKTLFIFVMLLGCGIIFFGGRNETPLFIFLCLSTVGIPFITAISLRKKYSDKWNQYIITLPLSRSTIVKSTYVTQISIVLIGVFISLATSLIIFRLQGFFMYRYVDVFLLFSSLTAVSLIMNSIFLFITYLDSKDRVESNSIISLFIAVAIVCGIITVINILLEKPNNIHLVMFGIGLIILAIVSYCISYYLSTSVYSKKEN